MHIASNAAPQTVYLYSGQQWDTDLRTYYNRARYYQIGTGRFWMMDTFQGNNQDPQSLHKYSYAADNPVINIDPNGHEYLSGLTVGFSALGSFFAQAGFGKTASTLIAAGNTPGPDVTDAVFATAKDVDNTWFAAGPVRASGAAMQAYSPFSKGGNRWWDVQKLNDVGVGDSTIDFENGS
jgi:RHS repeat-associated protein